MRAIVQLLGLVVSARALSPGLLGNKYAARFKQKLFGALS